MCEFEQLQRFLKEKERFLLVQLADLDRAIAKVQEDAVTKVLEEMSHLDTLIWEMEGKFQQPDSKFLLVRTQSDGGKRGDGANPESPNSALWQLPVLLLGGSRCGQGGLCCALQCEGGALDAPPLIHLSSLPPPLGHQEAPE